MREREVSNMHNNPAKGQQLLLDAAQLVAGQKMQRIRCRGASRTQCVSFPIYIYTQGPHRVRKETDARKQQCTNNKTASTPV